ncbi:polyketide synthase [Planctomycetaceae bacterium SH139]
MAAEKNNPLNPQISSLLRELRRKIRRYITIDAALAAVAVIVIAFWLGLAIDFLPVKLGGTEMPRSARAVLLFFAVGVLATVIIRFFFRRMFRRLPDESLALLLERHHPQLGGRLITAVQLNRPRKTGDLHSPMLLQLVHDEATAASQTVETGKVLRSKPLWSKAAVVFPLLLGVAALGLASPATLKQATARLLLTSDDPWPRRAKLRMVGVEVPLVSASEQGSRDAVRLLTFEDRVVRIARGGGATLRIEAQADDAEVPEVCTMYYQTASGVRGQVNMRRLGRVRDGYQSFAIDGPPLAGITEDLQISIRGLDARLDDYRIVAVDAPNITQLTVEASYPAYLREPGLIGPDRITNYQPGLRIREGTNVRLVGSSSTPVASVEAAVTSGDGNSEVVPVDIAPDGLSFTLALADLRAPTTVVMVPVDSDLISAPSPYRYYLGVVNDAAPEVQMRLRGIGAAVTPEVRIPLFGSAQDDYGLAELSIQLAAVGEQPQPLHSLLAVPDREGAFTAEIDIRDLANAKQIPRPQPGDKWNLFAEARDAYDLSTPHLTRSQLLSLEVVTPEQLLAVLERRELGLRSRLEQTISEMELLRDALDLLSREGWLPLTDLRQSGVLHHPGFDQLAPFSPAPRQNPAHLVAFQQSPQTGGELKDADESGEPETARAVQLLKLRIQQAGLQATKTADELTGVAAGVDDILLEMTNNRVDTPDRSERIASGVRDPLRQIVDQPLAKLRTQLEALLELAESPTSGPASAGQTVRQAEEVLLQLNAVLEKMLDLESYNEVLDLVRGLIENQENLIEETEKARKQAIQDLFRQ